MNTNRKPRTKADRGNPTWYTSADLAARWRVHQMTIRRWTREGKLKGYALSAGTIRYAQSDVVAFEEEAFTR
jgi:predicted site-specific integrase-resolvase